MSLFNIPLIIGVSYNILDQYFTDLNIVKTLSKYYNYFIDNFLDYQYKYIIMDKNYKITEIHRARLDQIQDYILQLNFDYTTYKSNNNDTIYNDLSKIYYMIYKSNNNYTIYNDVSKIDIESIIFNRFDNYKSKSQVKFLNIILLYEMIEYRIIFDNNNNYYIEDNILFDDKFMIFYCKLYLDLDIDLKKDYTITILDNLCQIIELHNDKYIQINATDYCIIERDTIDNVKPVEEIEIIEYVEKTREVEPVKSYNIFSLFF